MKLSKQQTAYQSDITQFLTDLKQKNPKMEEGQREGRARLWDKPEIDLDIFERDKASRVKQQAYVYQTQTK